LERLRLKWQARGEIAPPIAPAIAFVEPTPETIRRPVQPPLPDTEMIEHFPATHLHGRSRVSAIGGCDATMLGITAPLSRWAFLDTETTGVSGGSGTYAFLIGVGVWADGEFRIHQFFMRDFCEEPQTLDALAKFLEPYEVLVTYNGKTFDAPLLETRFRMTHRPVAHQDMAHLDLLHAARRLWKLRLQTCRLVELELAIVGYERVGDIPGMLIPARYFQYLRSGRIKDLQPVFYHNRMDILTLACLTSIVLGAVGDPSSATSSAPFSDAMDLYGLAGWLARLGRPGAALEVYARALSGNAEVAGRSRWAMAAIHKRNGDYGRAVPLWQELCTPDALVELAKYYEHRARDYRAALSAARAAGDEKRVARVLRKAMLSS
jgi:uncharacterized protein YprB with RNaseH-like and TPR domain